MEWSLCLERHSFNMYSLVTKELKLATEQANLSNLRRSLRDLCVFP
jgi:hypothetical protein